MLASPLLPSFLPSILHLALVLVAAVASVAAAAAGRSSRLGGSDGGGLCFLSLSLSHFSWTIAHTPIAAAELILYSGREGGEGRKAGDVLVASVEQEEEEEEEVYRFIQDSPPPFFLPSPQLRRSNLVLPSSPLLS